MLQKITLGGGCFWCLEAVYQLLEGVKSVVSGYAGGITTDPTYDEVCSGETGHAEVVQLEFDPEKVSLQHIFAVFFTIHDPTSLNRQGADVGTQYRSVIFYHDDAQRALAQEMIAGLVAAGEHHRPIVTQVEPLKEFYQAEKYHHNYFRSHPYDGYCRVVISPKVKKFKDHFLQEA